MRCCFLANCLVYWVIAWLTGWMVGWLAGRLALGWFADCGQAGWLAGLLAGDLAYWLPGCLVGQLGGGCGWLVRLAALLIHYLPGSRV